MSTRGIKVLAIFLLVLSGRNVPLMGMSTCYIKEATDMLTDLYELIRRHERKGDFTHAVVTEDKDTGRIPIFFKRIWAWWR